MKSLIVNSIKKKLPIGLRKKIIGNIQHPLRQWLFSIATKLGFNINPVVREELFQDRKNYHTLQFGSEESLVISQPFNSSAERSDELPNFIRNKIGLMVWKQPYVVEVADAELVGPTAVGFNREGKLLPDTVPTLVKLEKFLPTQTLIQKNLPSFRTPRLDTACSLVHWWSKNYSHWILECLTRIEGLEYYQAQTGKTPVLIIDANPTNWQKESLRVLGYEPNNCIQWRGFKLEVKRFIVPSFRRENRMVSPKSCQWLRQRMLSNLPDVGSKNSYSPRIYISRPKTAGRYIVNEDEVMAALTPLGFKAYMLENISFSEQVRLFSQAEIVVAPHGAGLTNIMFAQNLSIIELIGSIATPTYFLLAKVLGFQYGCLSLDNQGRNHYNGKFVGITVDITKLQMLLAEMICTASDRQPASTTY